MKDSENISNVASLNPDYLGFIFYSGSSRYVGEDFRMPDLSSSIKKVGVFVNDSPSYIIDMINRYDLDLVQLHGNESPALCEALSHIVGVIKSFSVGEHFSGKDLKAFEQCCTYFLFDTKTEQFGGSGKTFNWSLLDKVEIPLPFFVSGGIGSDELHDLMKVELGQKAFCIDVNSKFELEPGIKDVSALRNLTSNLEPATCNPI